MVSLDAPMTRKEKSEAYYVTEEDVNEVLKVLEEIYIPALISVGFTEKELFIRVKDFSENLVRIEFCGLVFAMILEHEAKREKKTRMHRIEFEANCMVVKENFFEAIATVQYFITSLIEKIRKEPRILKKRRLEFNKEFPPLCLIRH